MTTKTLDDIQTSEDAEAAETQLLSLVLSILEDGFSVKPGFRGKFEDALVNLMVTSRLCGFLHAEVKGANFENEIRSLPRR